MTRLKPSAITYAAFQTLLGQYKAPTGLGKLDADRYDQIPANLRERADKGDAYLTKEEVLLLVEWKLKHGTFRPTLLSLVSSNPAALVESTTREAFAKIPRSTCDKRAGWEESEDRPEGPDPLEAPNPVPAAKILTKLRGIGPATASLLLSMWSPTYVPFFSDELFRWLMWEEPILGPDKPAGGWSRKIKYTMKEYEDLYGKAKYLRRRLYDEIRRGKRTDLQEQSLDTPPMVHLEKVAYVLGQGELDLETYDAIGDHDRDGMLESQGEEKISKGEEKATNSETNQREEKVPVSRKRKVAAVIHKPAESERPRRSKRKIA